MDRRKFLRLLGVTVMVSAVDASAISDRLLAKKICKKIIHNNARRALNIDDALCFSIAYNSMTAQQDMLCETLFPTVTIDPDKPGPIVPTELITLHNKNIHSTTGITL